MISTAEREISELHNTIDNLVKFVKQQGKLSKQSRSQNDCVGDADETERQIFKDLLGLGGKLMSLFFSELTGGDLGYRVENEDDVYERKIKQTRNFLTVFGTISYERWDYYNSNNERWSPLSEMANLPEKQCSYFVQDLLSRLGIEDTYEKSRDFFEDLFGISMSPRTVEEVIKDMSKLHEDYEQSRSLPEASDEGEFQVMSFDGKGVPVIRNSGKKKEAIVGLDYTVNRNVRKASDVALSLICPESFSSGQTDKAKQKERARYIHYQASLEKGKEGVIKAIHKSVERRGGLDRKLFCLVDGAHSLINFSSKYFPDSTVILDIIHVRDYVWDAVHVFEKKGTDEAKKLAFTFMESILKGKVGYVIGGLRQRITKHKLRGEKKWDVEKVITYFENHKQYMNYDNYLAQGTPIGTGVVESACGHLVKNRMEKSGARWSFGGAEAVLKLRSIYANNDWKWFVKFRKNEEKKRLYYKQDAA